jgi:hypothetical protein
MLSGNEFESNGLDYLKTIEVVEAAYTSAALGQVVRCPLSVPAAPDAALTRRTADA